MRASGKASHSRSAWVMSAGMPSSGSAVADPRSAPAGCRSAEGVLILVRPGVLPGVEQLVDRPLPRFDVGRSHSGDRRWLIARPRGSRGFGGSGTAACSAAPDRLPRVIENPRLRLEDARLYLLCETVDEQRLEAALRGGVDVVELTGKRPERRTDPRRGGAAAAGLRAPRRPADAQQPSGARRRRPAPTACTSTGRGSTSRRPARRSGRRSCSAPRRTPPRRSSPRSGCRSTTSASARCTRPRSGRTRPGRSRADHVCLAQVEAAVLRSRRDRAPQHRRGRRGRRAADRGRARDHRVERPRSARPRY